MSTTAEVKIVEAQIYVQSANSDNRGLKCAGTVVVTIYPKKWQPKAN